MTSIRRSSIGRHAAPEKRRGLAVIGIVGELFLTAGVIVFLFIGWQLWLNDLVVANHQRDSALHLAESWAASQPAPSEEPPDASGDRPEDDGYGEPVSTVQPVKNKGFATLHIPRFGADYVRAIGEGVALGAVLNNNDLGVGHYEKTQLPGQPGNFALAAHRVTYGAPFNQAGELRVGDKLYVQTVDGWYTYAFRSHEYVVPTAVEVLEPVPRAPGAEAGEAIITLTTCNPKWSAAERLVAYGVLESWQPTAAGMPAELAAVKGAT